MDQPRKILYSARTVINTKCFFGGNHSFSVERNIVLTRNENIKPEL